MPMTWEIPGPRLDRASEVLRSVEIVSASDRDRNSTDKNRVRLGLRQGSNTSWVGSWDQESFNLKKGVPRSLLDERHRDKRIRDGQNLVLEIRESGFPKAINGVSVVFVFAPSGGFASEARPIVSTNTASLDPVTRPVVEDVIRQVNAQAVVGRRDTVPLARPVVPSAIADLSVYEDSDTSTDNVSSGTYVDGQVSVKVTMPAGVSEVYVHVVASVSFDSDAGGGTTCFLAIGDGTTDHNEVSGFSLKDGEDDTLSTPYAVKITEETTFKVRLKSTGADSADVTRQHIAVLAVALVDD